MHYQEKVKEFMDVFGQDCPSKPTIPDVKTRILRVKLLLEEVLELADASGVKIIDSLGNEFSTKRFKSQDGIDIVENPQKSPDIIEIADALADISYVNYGAANAYGIDIHPVEQEVHDSNMTKLFSHDEIQSLDRGSYDIVQVTENRYLVKNLDGKVQKSPSYTPANIGKHVKLEVF